MKKLSCWSDGYICGFTTFYVCSTSSSNIALVYTFWQYWPYSPWSIMARPRSSQSTIHMSQAQRSSGSNSWPYAPTKQLTSARLICNIVTHTHEGDGGCVQQPNVKSPNAQCTRHTVHCMWYAVYCTWYIVYCKMHVNLTWPSKDVTLQLVISEEDNQ